MRQPISVGRFLAAYSAAVVVAVYFYNAGYFVRGLMNAMSEHWHGTVYTLLTSIITLIVIAIFEWPVVIVLTLPLVLAAYAYQTWSNQRSVAAYVIAGAVIAITSASSAYFTILKWLSDNPDWPNPTFFTLLMPFAIFGGVAGAIVFRVIQFRPERQISYRVGTGVSPR